MRILVHFLVILLPFILASCGPVPMERLGMSNLSVSAGQTDSRTGTTQDRSIRAAAIDDDRYFKENRKEENRGSRRYQITPESFVLDIDDVAVYNALGKELYLSKKILHRVNSPAGIVPQHYDLVYADDFIRDALVQNSTYDGLSLQFLPGGDGVSSRGTSNDGFYVLSITGLVLPAEYNGILLDGEIRGIEGLSSELRYFGFEDLQPIETNEGFLSYLTIGRDVENNWVQNPMGEIGTWVNPVTITSGNAVALYLSSDKSIDINSFQDPEILFQWDMNNLVEIWDNGTPFDLSDDIVTYKLHDPFPVSLVIRENTVKVGSSTDTIAPSDVILAAIAGQTSNNTLQWINPQDKDLKEISIVRKVGQAPSDQADGEEVYRSYKPNYIDLTGNSGTHYYYLIQTVDYSGNYSSGVVLDQIQY